MAAKVFISHSSSGADSRWVKELAKSLERRGLSSRLADYDIRPDATIVERLEQSLRESDVVVVIVSPNYAHDPTLFFEIGAAIGMGKRVIPIVPPESEFSQLPLPLRDLAALRRGTPDEAANAIAATTLPPENTPRKPTGRK